VAEELLRRVKALQPTTEYSELTLTCEANIEGCYGRFESMISSLRLLLIRGGVYRAPVRRAMANAYHARHKYMWHRLGKDELHAMRDLMRENLEEELPSERDLMIWLQASRRLPDFDHLEAIDRFSRWAVARPSAEVHYYLYVLHFIRFYQGIVDDYGVVIENIDKCRALNTRTGRPRSYEWLAKVPTWLPLVHESELGDWDYGRNMFAKTDPLATVQAVVKRIKGPQSGLLALGPLDVFFVPGTEFLPGRDENARVRFFLGFAYEGLRAWGVERVAESATA